jgi:hypothetical protein
VTKTASFDTRRPTTSRMMPRIIMQRIYPAQRSKHGRPAAR